MHLRPRSGSAAHGIGRSGSRPPPSARRSPASRWADAYSDAEPEPEPEPDPEPEPEAEPVSVPVFRTVVGAAGQTEYEYGDGGGDPGDAPGSKTVSWHENPFSRSTLGGF